MTTTPLPLFDLARRWPDEREAALAAFERVAAAGAFSLGEELARFEEEFAAFCGTNHCIGVANGTAALELALRACGAAPGTEVITVGHTFVATVEAIAATGATPILVDVDPLARTIDPTALAQFPVGLPPEDAPGTRSVCHLFVIELDDRDHVRDALRAEGIATGIHYPTPVHLQPAWRHLGRATGDLPASEHLAASVLSLPVFPGIEHTEINRVVVALRQTLRHRSDQDAAAQRRSMAGAP